MLLEVDMVKYVIALFSLVMAGCPIGLDEPIIYLTLNDAAEDATTPDAAEVADAGVDTDAAADVADAEGGQDGDVPTDAVVMMDAETTLDAELDGGVTNPDAEPNPDAVVMMDVGVVHPDAGAPDATFLDAVYPDATPSVDSGMFDSGSSDSGQSDASIPVDAGPMTPAGFVTISPGVYPVGSGANAANVIMLRSAAVSQTELSCGEYRSLMGGVNSVGCVGRSDDQPLQGTSRHQVTTYLNALSLSHGYTPCYDMGDEVVSPSTCGCRLPTATEWEVFARAGEVGVEYSGLNGQSPGYLQGCRPAYPDWNPVVSSVAIYCANSRAGIQIVGSKTLTDPVNNSTFQTVANIWGLWDVQGNVWEETEGCNEPAVPPGMTVPMPVPQFTGCTNRVLRGGGWQNQAFELAHSNQLVVPVGTVGPDIGLRPVCFH